MRKFLGSGARSRVDDTGATLHIVFPEWITQLGGDEFKQCEGWHPACRSEMGDEIGWGTPLADSAKRIPFRQLGFHGLCPVTSAFRVFVND